MGTGQDPTFNGLINGYWSRSKI